ncbi:Uncharacterised protein [Escherichia coli]|uniref:Uncharacterized protein n=1 Tax=Escherichia coli TaxID=562 RepID=A0A376U2J4_ECOLX|nr:Uncharacterised protein [Escherichia coli]
MKYLQSFPKEPCRPVNRGKVIFLNSGINSDLYFSLFIANASTKLSLLFYSENTSNLNLNSDVLSVQDMIQRADSSFMDIIQQAYRFRYSERFLLAISLSGFRITWVGNLYQSPQFFLLQTPRNHYRPQQRFCVSDTSISMPENMTVLTDCQTLRILQVSSTHKMLQK